MKPLNQYLNEQIIISQYEELCKYEELNEGRRLNAMGLAIGKVFHKFWKWLMDDVKEKTDENDGIYTVSYNSESKGTLQKLKTKDLETFLKNSNSENKEGSFYKFYKKYKDLQSTNNLVFYSYLLNKGEVLALYCVEPQSNKSAIVLFACSNASLKPNERKEVLKNGSKLLLKKYDSIGKDDKALYENLDADNLDWKMETWFNRDSNQQDMFNKIFADKSQLDIELENGFDMQGFVNFIYDDVSPDSEKDYKYQFDQILNYLKQR